MRIAISGAGVAGTALAHWLQRSGHTPTLIERAPAFRTGGYMIDFWGIGYRVARQMGIEPAIRDAGYDVRCVRSVGPDGKTKAALGVEVFRRVIGNDFTSLPRGDLASAIYRTVEHKVPTVFGDSITGIDQHPDGVRVTFENGPADDFDLVIGADGLHSNVRSLVFGPEEHYEHYLGCKVAACVVDGYTGGDSDVYLTYSVPGRQVGQFTLRNNRTMFLFVFRDEHDDHGMTPKEQLHNQFDDAGWECRQILAAVDGVEDLYFDVVSQIRMDRWSDGRVLLIGDAAGCISLLGGEGTGLAITEAYALARELAHAGGDHRRAFESYESLLRPFIAGKQAGAERMLGFFATRTRFGLWFRNVALRAMNLSRPVAGLFAGSVRDDLDLPDYRIG
ncbi:FAD-binding domain [Mycobacterium sp. 134]|uniref:FAD-binding domain n=1 Tax=Mycobacterium sp. 134 TaxID=3400425 RepID=UPI003AAEC431